MSTLGQIDLAALALSPNVGREAAAQGVSWLVNNITGEYPNIDRAPQNTSITWKPGQAKKLQTYLEGKMKPSDTPGFGLDIDYKSVIMPIVYKKAIPWVLGASAILILLGRKLPL